MKIITTNQNGIVTIKPTGWLDTISSPDLGKAIDEIDNADSIVLDFENVEYMSSAGLRQVLAAHKKAKSLDATFSVTNICPDVMSIFQMTNIDQKIDLKAKA
ncbi:MAG: STAS domain-containing protein [Bacteroidaceae bacterium]|nr:STAS domain-containing protein [Bacteroidaceae bacterium]